MRYRYFTDANLNVICISTYAGKTVRGVAKCDITHDKFNEECGKKLSRARCDYKIATKRANRAEQKVLEAQKELLRAQKMYNMMLEYQDRAMQELEFTRDQLEEIESSLK